MLVEVKVPVLSEAVVEATLLSWHKKVGEHIDRAENLIEIETDKVVLELPAPVTGILAKIVKGDGATVMSGETIAIIETEAQAAVSTAGAPAAEPISSWTSNAQLTATDSTSAPTVTSTRPMMPAAQNIVARAHLEVGEINSIKGSGRGGRITKDDVAAHVERKSSRLPAAAQAATETVPAPAGDRSEQRITMSRLRARIAERLVQSQSTAAILTTFNEVNMQAIMDLRARYKDKFEKKHGIKLGLMSFFVKAAVAALKQFPIVNASVDGNDIVYHGYYDIGIAVSSPRGLVVPIIRDSDTLSQAEIEKKISDFGKRAQDGKLTIEELTGGTFSITNGGIFGSMLSTPIINPPQSAILGIHATKERPVAENGQVVIRPMNYLALSYDHRIIDGRDAVLSLAAMKEALEYPMSPLLET
ncbi:MAG: 2-oxoglutarate dehydrogenase complex dihydrolipoyllysine-residue succinyltransferase [Nitrosospira sp.]